MPAVNFYFQVHQPYRLRHYTFFDIGENPFYEDAEANRGIMRKVADKCYLPMNSLLLELVNKYKGRFKISFSLSGMAYDQMEEYAPEALDSFRRLVDTGCCELLAETYNHSLAFLFSRREFEEQVARHRRRTEELFGVKPTVFRNTELIYNNQLAGVVEQMGYRAILAEGADHVLDWRSPCFAYRPQGCSSLSLLLKNYRLSDDIAFRFSNHDWPEFPLTAEKLAAWVHNINGNGELVNLFMDYETFGEHQWAETGIFKFMAALPDAILANPDFSFVTPSEAALLCKPVAELDVPGFMSWADQERDLTAWLGNDLQKDAIESLYRLEHKVREAESADLTRTWRRLQTSDHFYYMCTKFFADGDVHRYFNPYNNPYDAYINYMNALSDFELRLDAAVRARKAGRPKAAPWTESAFARSAPGLPAAHNVSAPGQAGAGR